MKADLHTHTLASGHAFGTMIENARAAKIKGIELLAITDHGPATPGASCWLYFACADRAPKIIEGVRILFGVEAAIVDDAGTLDLPDNILKKLDIVMVGLHQNCGYEDQGIEKNTEVLLKAMDNPYVKMLSHPYDPGMKVDIKKIAQAAVAKNILLEINASNFFTGKIDKPENQEMMEKLKTMIKIFKDNNKKLIINSDAHNPYEIGCFESVVARFSELGLSQDDLLNNDPEAILKLLNIS